MDKQQLIDSIIQHPVIAAVRSPEQLDQALQSPVRIVFVLSGSINDLADICDRIGKSGRGSFLHIDLLEGLRPDQQGIKYLADMIRPTGIITTRPACVRWARAAGLLTVQRIFLLDSTALDDGRRNILSCRPDLVEVLPGVADKAIRLAVEAFDCPLIAGGLISSRQEIMAALTAGALAVSTGNKKLWQL